MCRAQPTETANTERNYDFTPGTIFYANVRTDKELGEARNCKEVNGRRGGTMPSPHIPHNQPHQPPLRLPECPWCSAPMRLARTIPHQSYTNLDLRLFECLCGTRISDVAARSD